MHKTFGYILLVLSIVLFLAIIGQIQSFVAAIFGFFRLFSGSVDAYQKGKIIGALIYWIVHVSLTIFLFSKARNLLKRNKKESSE